MTAAESITIVALLAAVSLAGYYLLVRRPAARLPAVPVEPTATGPDYPLLEEGPPLETGLASHPQPLWGLLDTLAVVLIVFAGFITAGLAAGVFIGVASGIVSPDTDFQTIIDTPAGSSFFLFIQWAVTVSLPLLYLHARGYRFDRDTFGFRKTRFGYALGIWIACMAAFYYFIPNLYVSLLEHYRPSYNLPEQDVLEPFGVTWGGFAIAVITVALVTPFVEEFLFRGVIHQGAARRLGFFGGALVSSGIFALAHYPNWELMPILFSIGFGFAVMLRATGSLWPPIVGHFFVNITAVLYQFKDLF